MASEDCPALPLLLDHCHLRHHWGLVRQHMWQGRKRGRPCEHEVGVMADADGLVQAGCVGWVLQVAQQCHCDRLMVQCTEVFVV